MAADKSLVHFLTKDGAAPDLWEVVLDGNSDFSDIADNCDIFDGDVFKITNSYEVGEELLIDITGECGVEYCGVPADGFVPKNASMRRHYRRYLAD